MSKLGIQYERDLDGNIFSLTPPDISTMFHLRPPSTKSRLPTPTSPSWLRGASKLLDAGFNQDSWRSLGQLLGYKDAKLDQLESTYQPSRALLKDWLETSGGTDLSTEMLIACLKDLKRFDVIDVIRESEGKKNSNACKPTMIQLKFSFNRRDQETNDPSSLHLLSMGQPEGSVIGEIQA